MSETIPDYNSIPFLLHGGIDGGSKNAKIWFVGIEWADEQDVRDWLANPTQGIPELSPQQAEEYLAADDCYLERRMSLIIGAIEGITETNTKYLPKELIKKDKFFQKNSRYAKLNLFPLAFKSTNNQGATKPLPPHIPATGFKTYGEYWNWCNIHRAEMFHKLIKTTSPKVIVCFGKGWWKDFMNNFTIDNNITKKLAADKKQEIYQITVSKDQHYTLILLPFYMSHKDLINIGNFIKTLL